MCVAPGVCPPQRAAAAEGSGAGPLRGPPARSSPGRPLPRPRSRLDVHGGPDFIPRGHPQLVPSGLAHWGHPAVPEG